LTAAPARPTNEQRIEHWTRETAQLRQLASNAPPVEPGSSLAADDDAFPFYPVSQVAWISICSAIDHHDMFLKTLCSTRTGFPFGYDTLARSAIIGAARALWVLDGPRLERIGRALRVAHEDYRQERATHEETRTLFPEHFDSYGEQIGLLDDRMARALAAGQRIGMRAGDVTARPNDTKIIRYVAERFASGESDPQLIVVGYMLGWRDGSGVAHGLRWTAMRRSAEVREDANGRPHYRASADIDKIVAAAGRVHLLTCRAVELYDRRRRSYTASG
jgi:hypothetical protein